MTKTSDYRLKLLNSFVVCCLASLGTRQQAFSVLRAQNLEPHRHWGAEPQRVLAVVVVRAFGQRVHENVEAVQNNLTHHPGDLHRQGQVPLAVHLRDIGSRVAE